MAAKKKKAVKKKPGRKPAAKSVISNEAEQIVLALKKRFGSSVTTLAREADALAQIREYIPTGVDVLDRYVIGRGGFPVGRMSEVFGEEGCGKTALLYRTLGACQRAGGVAALLDAEFSFDEERANTHGINKRDLIMCQPRYLEECLEMIKDIIRAHSKKTGPLFIGWDSIASMNTKKGLSLEAGETGVGETARLLSDELRDLPRLLTAHRAHLCMINQIRHKIGVHFGSNITTPGGNAPKFYSSVRLQFFGGKAIKNARSEHVGKVLTVMAVKNRLQAPFTKARVRLDYATGYNDMWTTAEHAKRMGLIKPRKKDGKAEPLIDQYLDALEELDWPFNEYNNEHDRIVRALQGSYIENDDGSEEADKEEDDE